jgi:16S rRNA (adenine1518-N6/adenine1519-N6)-dimethyltransferase
MQEILPGYRPRRRWGQNFLVDGAAAARIVAAFDPHPSDRVLEVGPGRGALTALLAGRVEGLLAVEVDAELAAALRAQLPAGGEAGRAGTVTVLQADILRADPAALLETMGATGSRLGRVIANLPYNIATAVILRLLQVRERLHDMVVMVQREVAARILSPPGRRTYGGLSILCQTYARCDSLLRLGPRSFRPRPKVESELIQLVLHPPGGNPALPPLPELARLLRSAFGQRRKTLANNLARLPLPPLRDHPPTAAPGGPAPMPRPAGHLGATGAAALLRATGLAARVRPEDVPVPAYHALLAALREL